MMIYNRIQIKVDQLPKLFAVWLDFAETRFQLEEMNLMKCTYTNFKGR